ncbi:hypothetical protein PAXINDRAFT_73356, partial [Paxillus involutus ATCC 200175]
LLPEGGIPDALCSVIRHTEDTLLLEQEKAGYVVEDKDEDSNDLDEGGELFIKSWLNFWPMSFYSKGKVNNLPIQAFVCRSAVIQVKKSDFCRYEGAFRSFRPSDLKAVSVEEDQHKPHANPTVHALKKHISTVRAKVVGTDKSQTSICAFVWGMTVKKGPLSLWITINPMDMHDSLAQVFTGADIDLDHFNNSTGSDSNLRAIRIMQDPFAATKFFHFTICAIINTLFGINSQSKCSELQ